MRFEFQEGIGMAIRKEVLRRRGALAQRRDAGARGRDWTRRRGRRSIACWHDWVTARQKGMEWISV